jgi:hypothetical protein
MGVQSLTLKEDATSIAPVAGTDLTYTPDGVSIPNGIHLAAASVTDFRVRPNITLKTKNPPLNADGTYGKGKRWLNVTVPKILADGTTSFNLVRIEVEVHPESTVAETTDLVYQAAQLLFDADTTQFIQTGSLA